MENEIAVGQSSILREMPRTHPGCALKRLGDEGPNESAGWGSRGHGNITVIQSVCGADLMEYNPVTGVTPKID